jgi:acyl-coenzyme A synthetase/AMP-(fatty) acid ligase
MDATKPAKVDPRKFIESLTAHGVTYSFGSPALWKVVARYCQANDIKLAGLKKVLMAGAPVSGKLIEDMASVLPDDAEIHTPYGATESLPIVSIESREIRNETWAMTRVGKGTCVGRALPGIDIAVIEIHDEAVEQISAEMFLEQGEIGEILVSGNVVTRSYDNNEKETRHSKTYYNDKLWHRMGDTGYLDESRRLWFCGRKAHRVSTPLGTKYTIQCEAIINNHPDIYRSALVGIYDDGIFQVPAIVLELKKKCRRPKGEVLAEVKELALASSLTADIKHYYFHPDFPVDIRHNAKIFREKLAVWVEKRA